MIGRLSDFLRASLSSEPGAFNSLESELHAVQAYLDIEAVRFGERLAVRYICDTETGGAMVPPLILQPLVENAVKYAVGPSKRTVTITVEARSADEWLELIVSDDGRISAPAGHGTGVGLRNVAGRLDALFGAEATLEAVSREGGFAATIHMPLRRVEPFPEPA